MWSTSLSKNGGGGSGSVGHNFFKRLEQKQLSINDKYSITGTPRIVCFPCVNKKKYCGQ